MGEIKDYVWGQIKALRPSFLSRQPHFNFLTAHYFWILGCALIGSIPIYFSGPANLAYIDALFFSSAASTQAGLNTVDVNGLNTAQQVLIYFIIMLTNPITVHSFVVFLRLYWFEKRFQHIVREARLRRRTVSKSKTKSRAKNDQDRAERGVNGRHITVMHSGRRSRITNDGILLDPTLDKQDGKDLSPQQNGSGPPHKESSPKASSEESSDEPPAEPQESRRPEIKFAETVKRSDGLSDDMAKLPPIRPDEDHIAIVERQRKGDDEILRIPGPRDAERGMLPERVEQGGADEHESVAPVRTISATREGTIPYAGAPRPHPDGRTQTITIEEPDKSKMHHWSEDLEDDARATVGALSFLRLRRPKKPSKKDTAHHHDEDNPLHITPSRRRQTLESIKTAFNRDKDEGTPYLSFEPTLGRNSQFADLNEEQREELGGIEYRSLKTLATILVGYYWGFSIFAVICLVPWILNSETHGAVVDAAGQSRTWWGIFTSHSVFMDVGLTLTPDSMVSFNDAVFPLILMTYLIIIGNTGFPVMLRFIIWILSLVTPRATGLWEELKFLLDHPRRCFTLLFPSDATWWLFWLLVILNGVDVIFFVILDLGSGPVNELPGGLKFLDGLFQAAATRTAGFSAIPVSSIHPAVQTSYMIMMYISVFPIAISVRRTNVYEEKALGIYGAGDEDDEAANASSLSYVGAHLRRQLSFDLWYIFVGFFILTISEGSRLMSGDIPMFAALFEIVSAYGTVGLSFGHPSNNASLCSQFSVIGKLVIIAMQIRGRHRGLPYGLDRAILLPSESLHAAEAEESESRLARRESQLSVTTTGRATSLGGRRRSRSMDRVNSNLIAQFLHPGPVLPNKGPSPISRRATSGPSVDTLDRSTSGPMPRRADTASLMNSTSGNKMGK